MIVLDAEVLLIDLRYPRDSRFLANRQALDRLGQQNSTVGLTCHTLLEVLGVCTFNMSPPSLRSLLVQIPIRYRLVILPDPLFNPIYAGGSFSDVFELILKRLALADSVTVQQLVTYFPAASIFLTWNTRHFAGKLSIPVLTPEEWLQQNPPSPQPPSPAQP